MNLRKILLASAALAAFAGTAAQAENVLKWGANRDIGSLDPYSYGDSFTINVLNHVYEGFSTMSMRVSYATMPTW